MHTHTAKQDIQNRSCPGRYCVLAQVRHEERLSRAVVWSGGRRGFDVSQLTFLRAIQPLNACSLAATYVNHGSE